MKSLDIEDAREEPLTAKQGRVLFFFNALISLAHAGQGIAILVLSRNNPSVIPILFTGIAGPPSSRAFQLSRVLFDMRMDIAIAIFFFFAAGSILKKAL